MPAAEAVPLCIDLPWAGPWPYIVHSQRILFKFSMLTMPTMHTLRTAAFLLLSALALASCTTDQKAPIDQPNKAGADSAGSPSGVPAAPTDTLPKDTNTATSGSRANAPLATPKDTAVQWVMSDSGAAGVTIGLTRAEVEKKLGIQLQGADTVSPCVHLRSIRLPQGVSYMFNKGTLARIDVDYPTVATDAGARVGDAQQRVESLYKGHVTVTPHKYLEGHYLTVRPKGTRLIYVFETEHDTVIRYRYGRLPEVEWVEGCS